MDKAYIVSGALFGDCGKGSVCDYLASKYHTKYCVRYNGGSQASHTVKHNDLTHRFSQLGSSFLNEDSITYLSENTVVNPFNAVREASVMGKSCSLTVEEIMNRIVFDKNAKVVTPYHSLINKLRELASGLYRGTTGSGVSEVPIVYDETGIVLTIDEILKMDSVTKDKLKSLFRYTKSFYEEKSKEVSRELLKSLIDDKDIFYLTDLSNEDYIRICYENLGKSGLIRTSPSFESFYQGGNVLFEGSQGILLDKDYGIKPNVTMLDTTNRYALDLARRTGLEEVKINATSVIASRHGKGILPTFDEELSNLIFDKNQTETYFQGRPIYGWLDLVLLRYGMSINKPDLIFLTLVDILAGREKIKACNGYIYKGIITEEFEQLFEYYVSNNEIVITNIKKPSSHLKEYLDKCVPVYEEIKGYNDDFSNVKSVSDLSSELMEFVSYIERNLKAPISYISFGADRNMKLRMANK